jgi:hypothetical protein
MCMTSPNLSIDQHRACAQRLVLLEGWALRTWRELAAVYGSDALVARAAEAAVGALGNVRDACRQQARQEYTPDVAALYDPPTRPPGGG